MGIVCSGSPVFSVKLLFFSLPVVKAVQLCQFDDVHVCSKRIDCGAAVGQVPSVRADAKV